jgi:uncharacterized protein YlxW (UPF0749 family)
MRLLWDFAEERGLQDDLEDRVLEETGNTPLFLGYHSEELDEPSDAEDLEATERARADDLQQKLEALQAERSELANLERVAQAASEIARYGAVARDLERAKMSLEDTRGLR